MTQLLNWREGWPYLLLTTAVAVAMALFAYFVDFGRVWHSVANVHVPLLVVSLGALWLCMLFFGLRWRLLLDDVPDVGYTFHVANVGHAVNAFVPLRAGEMVRIAIVGSNQQLGLGYTAVILSYMVERLFEQMMRLVAIGVALLLGVGGVLTPTQILSIIIPPAVALLMLLLIFKKQTQVRHHLPPLIGRIPLPFLTEARATHAIEAFLRNLNIVSTPRRLTKVFALSLAIWFFGGVYHLLVIASMGEAFDHTSWLPVALVALAFSPPSATTQPIIFQSLVVGPLVLAGFDQDEAFAYAVLLNLTQAFLFVVWGLFGLARLKLSFTGLRQTLQQQDEIRQMMRQPTAVAPEQTEKIDEVLQQMNLYQQLHQATPRQPKKWPRRRRPRIEPTAPDDQKTDDEDPPTP